ncbi:MAG: DNA mismatch repair protein MutS [Gemmatimonadaceae bacterium]|nr:DNA mismatch repair protein MutS [Gemmatimonadaceae bacterium]
MRPTVTPLMQQYREIKSQHQNAILFFRMGDFYEMFFEDAEIASRALGLTLTSRNNGGAAEVPLAGIPVKAASEYLRRLVAQGFRVAICEQVEDPKDAKGIVKRAVVETITPGAAFADDMLDGSRNNFLCAVFIVDSRCGIAAADISTGDFRLNVVDLDEVEAHLSRLSPRELLVSAGSAEHMTAGNPQTLITERADWEFDGALARESMQRQFEIASVEGFGFSRQDELALCAGGALLRYLNELQPGALKHLVRPKIERTGKTIALDEMTRRNLELTESLRTGDASGTLLSVLDRTVTPMGARLLRQWILAPLRNRPDIEQRLESVAAFVSDPLTRGALREALDGVRDIERLSAKISAGRSSPRDVRALGDSLSRIPAFAACLETLSCDHASIKLISANCDNCEDIAAEITRTIVQSPPIAIGEAATISTGFDGELDELRQLRDGGKDGIARIQMEERARTGINSLKVGYNRVFGYFIEVTNTNSHLVPSDYQRRQTLTGAERYVTPALKEYEERILSAAELIEERERLILESLRACIAGKIGRLQLLASLIAEGDVLATLAEVAERESYVRPEIHEEFDLEITAGRHPVVERMMPRDKFIPNDLCLSDNARLIVLTGPNMAGKSTILRQIGLIVLMAQMGSYVPASGARIGVVDKVFTRVGASDNLVRGQSTFMVEMSETSAILHTASRSSLVLLDEIGRGTSTYDGVSIAWAVSEHLHNSVGCKTVFATHYHELTQLSDELSGARNFNVQVREVGEKILFLHRLAAGGADRSYGIEVGRLAGLPQTVLARARELLKQLESGHLIENGKPKTVGRQEAGQLPLFEARNPALDELKQLDTNAITPLQALEILSRLVAQSKLS